MNLLCKDLQQALKIDKLYTETPNLSKFTFKNILPSLCFNKCMLQISQHKNTFLIIQINYLKFFQKMEQEQSLFREKFKLKSKIPFFLIDYL